MWEGWPLAPDSREALIEALRRQIQEAGLGEPDGLTGALLSLYAGMLAGTASRINRLPEKHRLAFLNLQQQARRLAIPAETPLVFRVADGYDRPVRIPKGTLAAAAPAEGEPVLFRTKRAFTAVPGRLTDLVWCDQEQDLFQPVDPERPFCAWGRATPPEDRHLAEWFFPDVFASADGRQQAELSVVCTLDGEPFDVRALADPKRCAWSLWNRAEQTYAPVELREGKTGSLVLAAEFPCQQPEAVLRLAVRDPALTGLSFQSLHVFTQGEGIVPESVVAEGRELDPSSFYPFGNPMQPFCACFLFCGGALYRPGARIGIAFDLVLEERLETLPEPPEEVDYKWIMRRPQPKPEPEIWEAFAQEVRWEYWNGATYAPLREAAGQADDFTRDGSHLRLEFDCPPDLCAGEAEGRMGYFLRLSCGMCDALYQLPRRVYTPRIDGLTFSFRMRQPVPPRAVFSENFGERRQLAAGQPCRPFCRPEKKKALFLGLDSLPREVQLQIFFAAKGKEPSGTMSVELGGVPLQKQDGTRGLTKSGILSVMLPEHPKKTALFGKERFWLCLSFPEGRAPSVLRQVLLNAQMAANRVRYTESVSYANLPRDGLVQLSHGNLVRALVWVRDESAPDGWTRWEPCKQGAPGVGSYRLDARSGILLFPQQIFARYPGRPEEDFIRVVYDTCDGARANVGVGAIRKLQQEIPFIDGVDNPLRVLDGEDSETDAQFSSRLEDRLSHWDRAVSRRDYERIAKNCCPQVLDVRCLPGRPIRLVLHLAGEYPGADYARIAWELRERLQAVGSAALFGDEVQVRPAEPVPMTCRIRLHSARYLPGNLREAVCGRLRAFLDPVSGGPDGAGWRIGCRPETEQLRFFLESCFPELTLASLTVKSGGKRWETLRFQPYQVVGKAEIHLEVEGIAGTSVAGR